MTVVVWVVFIGTVLFPAGIGMAAEEPVFGASGFGDGSCLAGIVPPPGVFSR
jgi:hypothetical protein